VEKVKKFELLINRCVLIKMSKNKLLGNVGEKEIVKLIPCPKCKKN